MAVKFKIAAGASESSVARVLDELGGRGLTVERLFPGQTRPALARIFVVRTPGVDVAAVSEALEPFGADVEYVEGDVKRKTFESGKARG
jgi:hypothetical protein